MKLFLKLSDIKMENVFLFDRKSNMIMDGKFTKLVYSLESFTMNGIYMLFPIKIYSINKNILYLNSFKNEELINSVSDIEYSILAYYIKFYNIQTKQIQTTLTNNLKGGSVKYYKEYVYDEQCRYYLKISGIWENAYEVGITYKIIEF